MTKRHDKYLSAIQCLPLGIAGALLAWLSLKVRFYHVDLIGEHEDLLRMFDAVRAPTSFLSLCIVSAITSLLTLAAAFSGVIWRRGWALTLIRKANAAVLAWFLFYFWVVLSVSGAIESKHILINGVAPAAYDTFLTRWYYLWLAAAMASLMLGLHISAWRRHVMNFYTGDTDESPARGDVITEDIRIHGQEPRYRKSNISSIWSHLLIIIIIPWLLGFFGCRWGDPLPFGGGEPAVQRLMIVKPKKKKKKKEYILSLDTAIIFNIPDLDDSKIYEEIEQTTRLTYMADANAAHGKLGSKTADQPGFWDGFLDGEVRFRRLEYRGADWDDGMDGKSGADINLLAMFREVSGGMKTALHGHSATIPKLAKAIKGQAPPFVYMTGSGGISVSTRELKILRKYLRGGGMLFADCGSPHWHHSFRGFVRQLFPGQQLSIIADDDPIFQLPFAFPHGAPPLWHHGGNRALGIKEGGRWVVFYHPGDVNDAWKTGHSGLDPDLADQAFQIGINVMYYAQMKYLEATRKYR